MTYQEALEYLAALSKFGINLGLARIKRLLALMGNPERCFRTIHVTGTNGKGSTTAMLAAILRTCGIRTGMYTSPHLLDYTERVVIDGRPLEKEMFAEAVKYTAGYVRQMTAEGWEHPTEFEVLTAAAFYSFAAAGVECAVIEVGLGGLLDSTNVIKPEISVITNVTLEHTDRCGGTVEEIAAHKAGIIKPGVPVVTGAAGGALKVIARTARENNAPLYMLGRDFFGQDQGISGFRQTVGFSSARHGEIGPVQIKLLGRHQVNNAAIAVMAALVLAERESRIGRAGIEQGLARAAWPGRFELTGLEPAVILDGAHNPDGARALRETLDALFPDAEITFLLGVLRDKDWKGIISALIRKRDRVVAVSPASERALSPEDIAREIDAVSVETAKSIEQGLERARELAGRQGVVCVAGSLYLVGTARKVLLGNK